MWNNHLRTAVLQNVRLIHFSHMGCSVTFSPEVQDICISNFDPRTLVRGGKSSSLPPTAQVTSSSTSHSHSFLYACHEKANSFPNSLLSLEDKRRVLLSLWTFHFFFFPTLYFFPVCRKAEQTGGFQSKTGFCAVIETTGIITISSFNDY